jgi:ubiquinone/menaquinone biosynthesis C-methylase UbiE
MGWAGLNREARTISDTSTVDKGGAMSLYEHYSKVYDLFNTNYDWCIQFVEEAIEEHTEGVQSLLELACGTGNILQHFVGKYEVSGLDLSASMLAQAREKLPGVPLYEMDMSAFELDKTYDAILCMYDSINHLLEYDDWIGTFNSVRRHLNPGGIFVFDMNTLARLDHKA